MTYDWQIGPGDEVKVITGGGPDTDYSGLVRYTPQATGDAWVIECKDGTVAYQQTYNRIVRMKKAEFPL